MAIAVGYTSPEGNTPDVTTASNATILGTNMAIYMYRPDMPIRGLYFAFHGSGRNAWVYRDGADDICEHLGLICLAPNFSTDLFPGVTYFQGNIVNSGVVQPPSAWTTPYCGALIDWARAQAAEDIPNGANLPVYLWGFSGGGQYLSRVAAFASESMRARSVKRIVVGSPGTYVVPKLGAYPNGESVLTYGMGGLYPAAEEQARLRDYVGANVTIYVGGADNDPNAADMPDSPEAMRQGAHRVERAVNTFNLAKQVAETNGWPFRWKYVVGPEIGHMSTAIQDTRRFVEALGPYEPPPVYRVSGVSGTPNIRLRLRGLHGQAGDATSTKSATAAP